MLDILYCHRGVLNLLFASLKELGGDHQADFSQLEELVGIVLDGKLADFIMFTMLFIFYFFNACFNLFEYIWFQSCMLFKHFVKLDVYIILKAFIIQVPYF